MGNCCDKTKKQRTQSEEIQHLKQKLLTKDLEKSVDSISFRKQSLSKFRKKEEILQDYKITQQIGSGLFSQVYLAIKSEKRVALKIIKKKNFQNKQTIHKILIEKDIMKILDHPNILKLNKTMQSHSCLFFELEFCEKGSLLSILNIKKKLSIKDIQVISAQIIEALFYIHSKGIVYGDLKAENVLMNRNGVIKLCDFNLSGTSSILNNTFQGTVIYMAPEIIDGGERSSKTDFWALGVLVNLMFYRSYPFERKSRTDLFFNILNGVFLPETKRKAPASLKRFIRKLLVLNPKERLGNNLEEFMAMDFFKGFDWGNYKLDPGNFELVKEIDVILEKRNNIGVRIQEDNLNLESLMNTKTDKFLYNVENFTYDHKED